MSNPAINGRKLVVGIHFGTRFSGAAWAETRHPDNLSVIEVWPADIGTHEGMSSLLVPTELRYTPDGIEWGFQIEPLVERNQWFKLGLANPKSHMVSGQQKSPEKLTTDYLAKLYEHIMYTLDQKLGASILRTSHIDFCVTVPTIWPDVAQQKMLDACKRAGLKSSSSEILIVSEPEAIATYSLRVLDQHGLKVGENFILCDAGESTVDLISYNIHSLKPILMLIETAPGSGGLCGSDFLNRRFGEFLVRKFGQQSGWDDEVLAEAMERFDTVIMRQFSTSTSNLGYNIPVPGIDNNEQLGVKRGRFKIRAEEIKGIFDPIVDKIIKLVTDQIRANFRPVSAVLLVGGFGQNKYLQERLRTSLNSAIQILQPPNASTAVLRGAVMMGIARSEASEISDLTVPSKWLSGLLEA